MTDTTSPIPAFYLDKADPASWKALNMLAAAVREAAEAAGVPRDVIELANVRISQLNGCAYCLNLHVRLAEEAGVEAVKLRVLPAWRETAMIFTEFEEAALAIAEAVTLLPDEDERVAALESARFAVGDTTYSVLCWAAATMNVFNRVSIVSRHRVRA
ncbi:carboxymuconolactone decarboxylase family protein [Sinomonas sp. ASV322]|uniref:carboxymuconolactone decarboxylase family protein n=1 Tax=Sinomonas sp. ASV322 TaxID=3041920 RepID=UPI0027DB6ED2|nr:carboxymuconolactone decarboxylase family protein [Sinomonas sp. ASV322]MDQ4503566.1 carboxymuconolactone decarboxylase family protein [Sinomonas sp. ASV322]